MSVYRQTAVQIVPEVAGLTTKRLRQGRFTKKYPSTLWAELTCMTGTPTNGATTFIGHVSGFHCHPLSTLPE